MRSVASLQTRRREIAEELEQARQDVANHKRFKELCKEFEVLLRAEGVGEDMERRDKAERDRLCFIEPPRPNRPRPSTTVHDS